MSDQKICPTCGTEYPLSERFCPRDGTALRSANASADLLGSVIADRYHILKKLGEGGMGTVYLAEHVKMGRKSALKVMNPGMNTDPDAIARFNREASNASRLSHPNICGIYDFGETPDGLIYLAMEFIEGSSLTSLIEKGGSLAAPRAASIVHQTADALQVAHDAGIVHRDLKPDNIMIAKNRDGSDLVKVVDFGIAKASSSDAQKVTKTGLVVGTPEYMSPEQLAGDKLDGRSDIYSLGLVAFNCLTGALPFAAETAQEAMIMRLTDRPRSLAEVAPDRQWPDALQATLDKALARDAGDRYSSAAAFGREFAAAIADMPMTQAVEAKTSVLGAVSAQDAATKAIPATRMQDVRPSAKTAQMEAPAGAARRPAAGRTAPVETAPAKKSMLVPALGGGGLAVAAIIFAVMKLGGGGTVTPPDPGATPTKADSTAVGDTGSNAAGRDTGTKAPPVTPLNSPGGTNPAPTPGKVPGDRPQTQNPGSTTPTAPDYRARMSAWIRDLDPARVDSATGARVNREINEVWDRLPTDLMGDAWFVRMESLAIQNDPRVCAAAQEVQRRSGDAEKRRKAGDYLRLSCDP